MRRRVIHFPKPIPDGWEAGSDVYRLIMGEESERPTGQITWDQPDPPDGWLWTLETRPSVASPLRFKALRSKLLCDWPLNVDIGTMPVFSDRLTRLLFDDLDQQPRVIIRVGKEDVHAWAPWIASTDKWSREFSAWWPTFDDANVPRGVKSSGPLVFDETSGPLPQVFRPLGDTHLYVTADKAKEIDDAGILGVDFAWILSIRRKGA